MKDVLEFLFSNLFIALMMIESQSIVFLFALSRRHN